MFIAAGPPLLWAKLMRRTDFIWRCCTILYADKLTILYYMDNGTCFIGTKTRGVGSFEKLGGPGFEGHFSEKKGHLQNFFWRPLPPNKKTFSGHTKNFSNIWYFSRKLTNFSGNNIDSSFQKCPLGKKRALCYRKKGTAPPPRFLRRWLKHSYRTHMPLHPGPDTRILRISRLRVTYELRSSKISRHFHCCFENTNGLWFVYKTKLTLEIKRKHLKEILR
jgi:hypothetical protein